MIAKVFAPLAAVLLLHLQCAAQSAESAPEHLQVFQEDDQADIYMLQMGAALHKLDQNHSRHSVHSVNRNSTSKGSMVTVPKAPKVVDAKEHHASTERNKPCKKTEPKQNHTQTPPTQKTRKHMAHQDSKHKQRQPAERASFSNHSLAPGKVKLPFKIRARLIQQEPGEEAPAEEAPAEEAPAEEAPAEEVPAGEAPGGETPAAEAATAPPTSETSAPNASAANASQESSNVSEATAAPTSEGEATPVAEGEPTPAEGEAAPAPEGEAAPAEGATAPAEGETAPAKGETAPAEGETAAAEGETASAEGGRPDDAEQAEAAPAEGEAVEGAAAEGARPDDAEQAETAPAEGKAVEGAAAEGAAVEGTAVEGEAAEGEAADGEDKAAPADGEATEASEGAPEGEGAPGGEGAPEGEGASEGEGAPEGKAESGAEDEDVVANYVPPVPERPDVSPNEGSEDTLKDHFAEIALEIKEAKIVSCVLLAMIFVFMVVHIMHEYDIHMLPEGVMIIIVGILLGLVLKYWCNSRMMFDAEYRSEIAIQLLNELFLPMLMLEAGWSVRRMDFISQLPYILNFAVFGTLISTIVIAWLLYQTGLLGMHQITTVRGAFVVASLISATDPVATLGTYSDLRVDPLLNIIVFGEAAINDAVAIVVFSIVNDDYYMSAFTSPTTMVCYGVMTGLKTLTCSFLLGGLTSTLVCGMLRSVGMHRNKKLEILVVVLGGYLSYALGEYFRVSGIICTLFNGMFLGKYAKFHLSTEGTMLTSFFISQMSTIMDSGVFLLSGVCCISLSGGGRSLGLYLMVFCVIARICSTIPCGLVSNYMKWMINQNPSATEEDLHILNSKYLFMIWHAGLRGGIAENLALQIGDWLDATNGPGSKESVRSAVFLLVAAYICIFGGTTKMFLQCMGIRMGASYAEDALSKTELASSESRVINWLHKNVFFPILVGNSVAAQNADAVGDIGDTDVLAVLHEVCHSHRGGTMRKQESDVPAAPVAHKKAKAVH